MAVRLYSDLASAGFAAGAFFVAVGFSIGLTVGFGDVSPPLMNAGKELSEGADGAGLLLLFAGRLVCCGFLLFGWLLLRG